MTGVAPTRSFTEPAVEHVVGLQRPSTRSRLNPAATGPPMGLGPTSSAPSAGNESVGLRRRPTAIQPRQHVLAAPTTATHGTSGRCPKTRRPSHHSLIRSCASGGTGSWVDDSHPDDLPEEGTFPYRREGSARSPGRPTSLTTISADTNDNAIFVLFATRLFGPHSNESASSQPSTAHLV